MLNANLSLIEYFSLMSIVDAIPLEWRQMISQNTQHVPPYMSDTIYLNLDNSEITQAFKSGKQAPPTAQTTFKETFSYFSFNWNETFLLFALFSND